MRKTSNITLAIVAGLYFSVSIPTALGAMTTPLNRSSSTAFIIAEGNPPPETVIEPCSTPVLCLGKVQTEYSAFLTAKDAYITQLQQQVSQQNQSPPPSPTPGAATNNQNGSDILAESHKKLSDSADTVQRQLNLLSNSINSPPDSDQRNLIIEKLNQFRKDFGELKEKLIEPLDEGVGNKDKLTQVQEYLIKASQGMSTLGQRGSFDRQTYDLLKNYFDSQTETLSNKLDALNSPISKIEADRPLLRLIQSPLGWLISLPIFFGVVGLSYWLGKKSRQSDRGASPDFRSVEGDEYRQGQRQIIDETIEDRVAVLEQKLNGQKHNVWERESERTPEQIQSLHNIIDDRIASRIASLSAEVNELKKLGQSRPSQSAPLTAYQAPDVRQDSFSAQPPPPSRPDFVTDRYNNRSDFPTDLNLVDTVAETTDSLGDRRLGKSIVPVLGKNREGEYWIVHDFEHDRYCLVPRRDAKPNAYSFETLKELYECDPSLESSLNSYSTITLIRPAIVSRVSDGIWRLETKGRLL
jgi:hypothetical protein